VQHMQVVPGLPELEIRKAIRLQSWTQDAIQDAEIPG